jgi:hypothetical protein
VLLLRGEIECAVVRFDNVVLTSVLDNRQNRLSDVRTYIETFDQAFADCITAIAGVIQDVVPLQVNNIALRLDHSRYITTGTKMGVF